jgi:D-alanyl-D-alanine carboxypeptidase (penicillin-binding protein 5/6)
MSLTPGRIVGIAVGAVAILGIGVYGPAMLLGPLPAVAVEASGPTADAPAAAQIPLPAEGASAVVAVGDDGAVSTIATGGEQGTVPIGGAAKLVTMLVTLESLPLTAGSEGPGVPIGPEDYTDYLTYQAEGSRVLQVSPGDSWSQRDVLRAVLLASSNNHADTLARWAFGSVEQYTTAANEWLAANGFPNTTVADATGLSGDNVGTAAELAGLAARVVADPALSAILDGEITGGVGVRQVPDVISHLGDQNVRALARSFTDQALITFVFTRTVPGSAGNAPVRIVGAMSLVPDYETLDPAVTAVLDSAGQAATPVDVIAAGSAYGTAVAAWGDRADLVASATRTSFGWSAAAGEVQVDVDSFTTASAGRDVGRVSVPTPNGDLASPLTLSADIRDPGPMWRLTNPFAIIGAYFGDA